MYNAINNMDFIYIITNIINHNNPPANFSVEQSMKEKHANTLITTCFDKNNGIQKAFHVKTYASNGIGYSRLGVNNRICLIQSNNIITCFYKAVLENPENYQILQAYKRMVKIQEIVKDPEKRFKLIFEISHKFILDFSKDNPLKISLVNITKVDPQFKIFEGIIKPILDKEKIKPDMILGLFPKNSNINRQENKMVIEHFINLLSEKFPFIKSNAKKIFGDLYFQE